MTSRMVLGAALLMLGLAAAPAQAKERRCGWLANPTPGNFWLNDSGGEWVLPVQGGEQPEGMDDMPDMTVKGWVKTNGHYGYGCACLDVEVDRDEHKITRLYAARPLPLAQCRADRALKRPD